MSSYVYGVEIFAQNTPSLSENTQLSSNQNTTTNWQLYSSPIYALKIKHPATWNITEDRGNVRFREPIGVSSDGERKYAFPLTIEVMNNEQNQTAENLIRDDMARAQSSQYNLNFKLLGTNKTTLANGMQLLQYTDTYETRLKEEIKALVGYTTSDGLVYRLDYTAYPDQFDKYLSTIKLMIDSFEPLEFGES